MIHKRKTRNQNLEILFAGDFCPRLRTEKMIVSGKSDEILSNILTVLENKDLSVVNLETPLTKSKTAITKSGPNLKADPRCVDFLIKSRFDIATLANNHIGDYGPKSVLETINIINRHGIKPVGAGKNIEDARKPLYLKKKGIKVAILNLAENEFGTARENLSGSSSLDTIVNIKDIQRTSKKSDITIVIIHGGNETNPIPSPRMVMTCRAFAEVGASAVIVTHPHCPQGIEIWNGKPIIYSMGNFLFDNTIKHDPKSFWWIGYTVKIFFDKYKAVSLNITPYTFGPSAEKICLLTGKKKDRFFKYLTDISEIIKNRKKIKLFWDAWCVMKGPALLNCIKDAKWPVSKKKIFSKMMVIRNVFTCESHNELLNNFLRVIEEKRVTEAGKYIPKIKKFQTALFNI